MELSVEEDGLVEHTAQYESDVEGSVLLWMECKAEGGGCQEGK